MLERIEPVIDRPNSLSQMFTTTLIVVSNRRPDIGGLQELPIEPPKNDDMPTFSSQSLSSSHMNLVSFCHVSQPSLTITGNIVNTFPNLIVPLYHMHHQQILP